MIPILVGIWVVVGVLALVLLVRERRLGSRRRERRLAKSLIDNPDAGALDSEWIYGDRAERGSRADPREPKEEATREAETILREAESRAREIVLAAEAARARIEAELAREQADVAEKGKRLSEFLASTLAEVERATANGSASSRDLAELEALRDELSSTE